MKTAAMKALVILAMSGCSFALVTGPSDPPEPTDQCTTTPAAPIVDVVLGTAGVVTGSTVVALLAKSQDAMAGAVMVVLGIPPLIAGITYLASSAFGYSRVSRCRKQRDRWRHIKVEVPGEKAPAREIQVEEAAGRERHEQCLESRASQLRNAGRITARCSGAAVTISSAHYVTPPR